MYLPPNLITKGSFIQWRPAESGELLEGVVVGRKRLGALDDIELTSDAFILRVRKRDKEIVSVFCDNCGTDGFNWLRKARKGDWVRIEYIGGGDYILVSEADATPIRPAATISDIVYRITCSAELTPREKLFLLAAMTWTKTVGGQVVNAPMTKRPWLHVLHSRLNPPREKIPGQRGPTIIPAQQIAKKLSERGLVSLTPSSIYFRVSLDIRKLENLGTGEVPSNPVILFFIEHVLKRLGRNQNALQSLILILFALRGKITEREIMGALRCSQKSMNSYFHDGAVRWVQKIVGDLMVNRGIKEPPARIPEPEDTADRDLL